MREHDDEVDSYYTAMRQALQPPAKVIPEDSIVTSVLTKFKDRQEKGYLKYGLTLDRTDLNMVDWLNHLQEELMDATLYIERLKKQVTEVMKVNVKSD